MTPDKLLASTGTGWPWQSYTPTLTNLSGGTITYAKYVQVGKTVHVRFKYVLGGAGVSGMPRITVPVTAHADYVNLTTCSFNGGLLDATGFLWEARSYFVSTTAIDIGYQNTSANFANLSSTAPFTWAVNDVISFGLTYEAA